MSQNADPRMEEPVYRKVTRRLVPFLFLCYLVAYLDRVNVGFAKLQMLADLRFSETVYGLGAGIFFIGYFFFEVPSNLLLHRVGARRWIARIMISWGLISGATMFVNSVVTFYVLRFVLGLAEAGFFPGIILYLTYWYPAARRGRVIASFMSAIAVAGVLGGPMSGWIMQTLAGSRGLAGWQWLFLIEGIPSVLVGIAVLFYLDDRVDDATWLNASERTLIKANVARDQSSAGLESATAVFASGRVYLMSAIYFCLIMGLYGVSFWLPQLVKSAGVKDVLTIGLLTAIPYGAAAVAMILASRHSDRTGERRWHVAGAALLGAAGLLASCLSGSSVILAMAALSLATMGILTSLPLFWSMPTAFLRGTGAAAGIAVINSVGNLAGFVSPFAVGAIKDATHSVSGGLVLLACVLVIGALFVLMGTRPTQFEDTASARSMNRVRRPAAA